MIGDCSVHFASSDCNRFASTPRRSLRVRTRQPRGSTRRRPERPTVPRSPRRRFEEVDLRGVARSTPHSRRAPPESRWQAQARLFLFPRLVRASLTSLTTPRRESQQWPSNFQITLSARERKRIKKQTGPSATVTGRPPWLPKVRHFPQ